MGGRGRGEIIKKILELTSSSSEDAQSPPSATYRSALRMQSQQQSSKEVTTGTDESATSPHLSLRTGTHPQDSGLGSLPTGSPVTQESRTFGRGKHFISISSSSSRTSTEPDKIKGGMGRAKLMHVLQSISKEQSIEEALPHVATTAAEKTATELGIANLNQKMSSVSVADEIEQDPIQKRGTKGVPLSIVSNYIRLKTDPDKGVFEYEVRYSPAVHASQLRYRLLNQHKSIIGNTKTFDGVILYLPIRLNETITHLTSTNENDTTINYNIEIIFKKKKRLVDCIHLYNVLFDRIMKTLNFVRLGRKLFDPTAPKLIPQHKLEVWPGYVTAVDEYEDGVMLCLDVSHRVLCQTTVLDLMKTGYLKDKQNFQTNMLTALMGSVVLTRYNNRSYRVDDIKFDASPKDTFSMNDRQISYVEYYKQQYNIEIIDVDQPLLIHNEERKVSGKSEKEFITFCLVPELCFLTGLTDEMRSNFQLMRDVATFTRVTPNQRIQSFNEFCTTLNRTPEARDILNNWGLTLESTPIKLEARNLGEENIIFKQRSVKSGPNADFNRAATSNELLSTVNLTNWIMMFTRNDSRFARNFVDYMEKNAKPMGISVSKPHMESLDSDKTELYVQALRRLIRSDTQIVVILCPTSRDDRYAAIKKVCCSELPIPSQVINSRTLSKEDKNRAIVQKIALQMNCKLGGALWSIKIPLQNTMICGIDTYHDSAKKEKSVSAFVSSLNSTYTRWFSRPVIQKQKEELINGLCVSFIDGLSEYKKWNDKYPDSIILYRDGVGDGQLNMCREYEIPQMQRACQQLDPNYKPGFTFIVVQKRINTRVFANAGQSGLGNPQPGCVLDHTITRRHYYDFFLVPQSVRQGTVTPTHYIVVEDTNEFSPDILQKLSYKLCFLYYNWPGTVRVPACCQYAHKLAFLVGQSIKRPTAESLATKLFYL